MTIFANKNAYYHATTYRYTNLQGAGESNVVQNVQHQNLINVWHFVYFGYSRVNSRAFLFIYFKNGPQSFEIVNLNHYLVERLYFLLRDARY